MRRLSIIFLLLLAPIFALCQRYSSVPKNYETEFDKLIEKHDFISILDTTRKGDAAYFWRSVIANNEDYNKFNKSLAKNKAAARNVISEIDEMPHPSYLYSQLIDNEIQEEYKGFIYGDSLAKNARIFILNTDKINAFADPRGEICVYTGLINFYPKDKDTKILGVLAHEMSHFALQHMAIRMWKERRNKTLAGVILGLEIAADGAAAVIAASGGTETSTMTQEEIEEKTNKYLDDVEQIKYKHSREQEIEADLIAVRLLEWLGYDPWLYVEGLNDLMVIGDTPGGYTSSHPKTRYRIAFLTYLLTKHRMKSTREIAAEVGLTEEGWSRMNALNQRLTELGYSSDYHIGAGNFQDGDVNWDELWNNRIQNILKEYMKNETTEEIEKKLVVLKKAYDLNPQEEHR